MAVAGALVIGIEQKGVIRIEAPITRHETGQNKGFEKPGYVRQMPFCRAGIGHGLHHHVLHREGRRDGATNGASGGIARFICRVGKG